ncbi:MAG: methyl-accepting chemotaxis protein [Fusobacteriaceae bacterium]|jgi:methyl-accepting chemotaxis protein|nr:hypothetical protein [Fusobacteriales bacterium]MDN5304331.1 methyl-accepting chemotaxis protein [Fusobacteriaceae bacterium]
MRLKRIFYFVFPGFLILSILILVSIVKISQVNTLNYLLKTKYNAQKNIISQKLHRKETVLNLLIDKFKTDEKLKNYFYNKQRKELFNYLNKEYDLNNLKNKYNISIIHFHTQDIKSFLRTNNYNKYGDDLTWRKTIVATNKNKKDISGIEIGKSGLMLRYLAPIYYNSKFIGTVEAGILLDNNFLSSLEYNNILYQLYNWKNEKEEILFYENDDDKFENNFDLNQIKTYIYNNNKEIFNEKYGFFKYINSNIYFINYITDFEGKVIGGILTKEDATSLQKIFNVSIKRIIITLILILLISITSYVYIGKNILNKVLLITNVSKNIKNNDYLLINKFKINKNSNNELEKSSFELLQSISFLKNILIHIFF